MSAAPLLEVEDLRVRLPVGGALRPVLHGVSFTLGEGEALSLVGESGSGKSMTARAIARLLPDGALAAGVVRFAGEEVLGLRGRALREHRTRLAMVFQDPRAHVNPVWTIGSFLGEGLRSLQRIDAGEVRRRSLAALSDVGIADPERRLRQHPHELSGGLLQRVMIAAALLAEPRLLLADEPTTALDVTTQAEVMAILDELRRERGMALLFITHDLELAAATCDRTAVMYAGQLVELRDSSRLHDDPLHPYTAALGAARPDVTQAVERLAAIPGRPVSAFEAPSGCPFAPRCPEVRPPCSEGDRPGVPEQHLGGGRVRCLRAGELRGRVVEAVSAGA